MIIQVTKQDIGKSYKHPKGNPVAQSIRRIIARHQRVTADPWTITVGKLGDIHHTTFSTSRSVNRFLWSYYHNRPVKPFNFKLV